MLRTQETLAIQTDVLPTQNIGHLDQNQPQIFSLLSGSNNSTSIRKPRRKKNTKLEEAIPVMINPQITRTPTGVTFGAPLNHSVTLPESLSPIVSTRLINSQTIPLRFYIEHDSYDANNNINHNQNQSLPIPLTTSVSVQTQRTSTWPNEFISDANSNSLPQLITESQFLKLNQLLNSRIDEAASVICATKQNEHKHIIPSSLSIMTTAKPTRSKNESSLSILNNILFLSFKSALSDKIVTSLPNNHIQYNKSLHFSPILLSIIYQMGYHQSYQHL